MQGELTKIIQQTVQECGRPAVEVAMDAGKPYPLFMREINPADVRAKIGVDTLLPIMLATGRIDPLEHLAGALNHALVPLDIQIDVEAGRERLLFDLVENVGRFCESLRKALSAERLTEEELIRLEALCNRTASAMAALIEPLRKDRRAQGRPRP